MPQQSRAAFASFPVLLPVVLAGLALAGCAQQQPPAQTQRRGFSPSEYGVAASPRVVEMGQPVPRGGGVYRVGRPYVVRGRTYTPQENPSFEEVGMASWYGDDFHGRRTANGEVFDMYGFSAAHRTLPMPSYARVTNVQNGRSVVVRINDRGPFHSDRVIDLSRRTAQVLDIRGTGRVRVTYFGRATLEGNDDWLVTTVRNNGAPVPAQQVAALAPVPAWAQQQQRPSQGSPSAVALASTMAPLPPERPREQPVQLASLAPPVIPARQPAEAAATSTAPAPVPAPAPGQPTAATLASAALGVPQQLRAEAAVAATGTQPLALVPLPPSRPAAPSPTAASAGAAPSYVHVGSFRDAAQAGRYRDALAGQGVAVVDPVNVSGITLYQVRIGPLRDGASAERALEAARREGATAARITQGT